MRLNHTVFGILKYFKTLKSVLNCLQMWAKVDIFHSYSDEIRFVLISSSMKKSCCFIYEICYTLNSPVNPFLIIQSY